VVLKKTVDYMRAQLEERRLLVRRLEDSGAHVEEGMKR
jgi:heteromeric Ino2p/Ino4p transcription factor